MSIYATTYRYLIDQIEISPLKKGANIQNTQLPTRRESHSELYHVFTGILYCHWGYQYFGQPP